MAVLVEPTSIKKWVSISLKPSPLIGIGYYRTDTPFLRVLVLLIPLLIIGIGLSKSST
jgi:hypothetical protein